MSELSVLSGLEGPRRGRVRAGQGAVRGRPQEPQPGAAPRPPSRSARPASATTRPTPRPRAGSPRPAAASRCRSDRHGEENPDGNDGLLLVNSARCSRRRRHPEGDRTTLQSQLDQLEGDAGPLVATWDGAAQEAYAQRQAKWRSRGAAICTTSCRTSRARSTQSAADYVNTERQATAAFPVIAVRPRAQQVDASQGSDSRPAGCNPEHGRW